MPVITLTDGSKKQFDHSVTVSNVAKAIGSGLFKAAVAGKVDQELVDTSFLIDRDVNLEIITSSTNVGLEVIRHSTAHLLAQAVKRLFPSAQVTIGPVIDNGFYYDFSFERPFTPEDLERIEAEMSAIVEEGLPIEKKTFSREEAIELFSGMGEDYKVSIIKEIPEGETLTAYQQGDFIDLCRGPHVPITSFLKAFKLTKVAGAYWRGDSSNEMLQRIYGTAWQDKKALKAYLKRIEEAEKRDHRKIAQKMDLYHIQPEAPGMIFWHPNGWTIYTQIEEYIREKLKKYQYQEINTPQVMDMSLWEQSGHAEKFLDEMFVVDADDRQYAIKPMSCPGHVQVFKQKLHSYRDLPIRFAEFGCCHRNEMSGTLHGLMRVRALTQDDAHVFCTEDQVADEIKRLLDMVYEFYADFGFESIEVQLSTRPEQRVGSDEIWDKAEAALSQALDSSGVKWGLQPGEGAFYGPKIEFTLYDCLERPWQCGTIQLDFAMPERLGATYIDSDGSKKTPVMLHRAIIGSFERFIGVLLEHYEGKLPLWLSPVQAMVLPISEKHEEYVEKVVENLHKKGIRVRSDLRNEKIGYKIREHVIARVPYILVVGDQEVTDGTVSVRALGKKETITMPADDFQAQIMTDIAMKRRVTLG